MPPFRTARVSQKGHDVRALATSLHLFNKVDLQAVMKARRWSSGGTFTSFYLPDLCPQADSILNTGSVVAADFLLGSFIFSILLVARGPVGTSILPFKKGGSRWTPP